MKSTGIMMTVMMQWPVPFTQWAIVRIQGKPQDFLLALLGYGERKGK
jgi:hypothetical protein